MDYRIAHIYNYIINEIFDTNDFGNQSSDSNVDFLDNIIYHGWGGSRDMIRGGGVKSSFSEKF